MIEVLKQRMLDVKDEMQILIFDVFFENAGIIEEMNRDQLRAGFRADGIPLPNYSEVSIQAYGKPRGRIKLLDTGAFYKGFQLDANPEDAYLLGMDEKTEMLEERYGSEIIGMSEANKDKFRMEVLMPEISKKLKSIFND